MTNETITFLSLSKFVADGKAPKKIKYLNIEFEYDESSREYFSTDDSNRVLSTILSDYFLGDALNKRIEILPEENVEWEDIEEYQYSIIPSYFDLKSAIKTINENFEKHQKALISLVKNQKYLKEKLEVKDES